MCVYSPRVGEGFLFFFIIDSKIYLFLQLYNFSFESDWKKKLSYCSSPVLSV